MKQPLTHTAGARVAVFLRSRFGVWCIGLVSLAEALLPIPIITDPFLVAGILANRARAVWIVGLVSVSSVVGGLLAYLTARYFFNVLMSYMSTAAAAEFTNMLAFGASSTFLATLVGAVTPVPYTIVTWVIGAADGNLWLFILASVIGRTGRYAIVGYATYRYGAQALVYARQSAWLTSAVIALLVLLYLWLKL
jgi:membrane protein YqaA with SNARE-associated domain